MRMRWIMTLLIVTSVRTSAVIGQVHPAFADSGLSIATVICEPISAEALAQYSNWLQMNEAQLKFAEAHYRIYLHDYKSSCDEALRQLKPLSDEVALGYETGAYDIPFKRTREEFLRIESIFVRQLDQMDEALLGSIETILGESQKGHLQRVRDHRTRRRCAAFEWEVYGSQIDLSAVIESMRLPEEALQTVDGLLRDYESVATPLMQELDKRARLNRAGIMSLIVSAEYADDGRRLEPGSAEQMAARERCRMQMETMLQSSATLQKRVAECNRRHVLPIVQALSANHNREFLRRYRRAAFPYVVHPDQTDPMITCGLLIEQFTAESRQDADRVLTHYQAAYAAVTSEMESAFEAYRVSIAQTKGVGEYPAYREQITRMRDQRWALNEGAVKQLFVMLSSDAQVAVRDEYEDYLRRLHGVQSRLTSREWPGY